MLYVTFSTSEIKFETYKIATIKMYLLKNNCYIFTIVSHAMQCLDKVWEYKKTEWIKNVSAF